VLPSFQLQAKKKPGDRAVIKPTDDFNFTGVVFPTPVSKIDELEILRTVCAGKMTILLYTESVKKTAIF